MEKANIFHIWQGELVFMYDPLVYSARKFIETKYPDATIDVQKSITHPWETIASGDVLIWVGCFRMPYDQLSGFRERGIYTIYYNTEPCHCPCAADEIWSYSKEIYRIHVKESPEQIIRFVPIVCEDASEVTFVPYGKASASEEEERALIFIGSFGHRKDKHEKMMTDSNLCHDLKEVYNLWNETDYNKFMGTTGNIFLNVTKTHYPIMPSVRVNKLLSHGCIVISEHTNETDDELYEGLVFFADTLEDVGTVYQSLRQKTPAQLQEISDEIYRKFHAKFNAVAAIDMMLER